MSFQAVFCCAADRLSMSLAFGAMVVAADAAVAPESRTAAASAIAVCVFMGSSLLFLGGRNRRLELETPRAKALFRYNPAMFRGAVSRLWPPDAALLRAGAGPQPAALESLAPGPANALHCADR